MSEVISSTKSPASIDKVLQLLNYVGRESSGGRGPRSLAEYDEDKGLRLQFSYSTTDEVETAINEMKKFANVNSIAADQNTLRVWLQFADDELVEFLISHPWLSRELEGYYVKEGKLKRGKHLLDMELVN